MLCVRHYKLEAELAEMNWRVRWDDIMFGTLEKRKLERSGSRTSLTKVSCPTWPSAALPSDSHLSTWPGACDVIATGAINYYVAPISE